MNNTFLPQEAGGTVSAPSWVDVVATPAWVLDLPALARRVELAERLRTETGLRVLYTLKPLLHPEALRVMAGRLDGFAVSSPFEARAVRELVVNPGIVSLTTPGLQEADLPTVAELCDHVAFNSLSQWERWAGGVWGMASPGLRINPGQGQPELDLRCDPCRPASKLGAPLKAVAAWLEEGKKNTARLEGLHFHNHCEAEDFRSLRRTVERVQHTLGSHLARLRWINLGGGLPLEGVDLSPLQSALAILRRHTDAELFLEPGAALVRPAGYLVATVIDQFESDGVTVAVLDTSVNHAPEVFEYGWSPPVLGADIDESDGWPEEAGGYSVLLAGSTCLSGDLFGTYRFAHPVEVGDRVVFGEMGAYTLVKAHWFNGQPLPTLYTAHTDGRLDLYRRFSYADYRAGWLTGPVDGD